MTLKSQQGIVASHAMAIVGNADQLAPASLDLNANARCFGIQRVLQQLFHHRRGPLHHLARGDLVGNLVGKDADATHAAILRGYPLLCTDYP